MPTKSYSDFINNKTVTARKKGVTVAKSDIDPILFPFQRDTVHWALEMGCAALFQECGMGKTLQYLEWSRHVSQGGRVLIITPLGVAGQTVKEAEKLGMSIKYLRADDPNESIVVTNYEMIHHFDASLFTGVVLDESSILKSYMGKTKRFIIDSFRNTPFKLACTATPAPNDHMELGNHAEFLGIMPSSEMLSRWFINDTMKTGHYRLKNYAREDFYRWISSWGIALNKPSDLGYSDDGFILPKMTFHQHIVDVDHTTAEGGKLFRFGALSATELHKEMRLTSDDRADKVWEIISLQPDDAWVTWCNTNYEADALMALMPHAVEVRGDDSPDEKLKRLNDFTFGTTKQLVTKASIAGFGLNWQHCHNTIFAGVSHSYEMLYQALRRFYRFGQKNEVNAHLVLAESELSILSNLQRKQDDHMEMQTAMIDSIKVNGLGAIHSVTNLASQGNTQASIPSWLMKNQEAV
jgi:superfamily II DNA or RNA helicase